MFLIFHDQTLHLELAERIFYGVEILVPACGFVIPSFPVIVGRFGKRDLSYERQLGCPGHYGSLQALGMGVCVIAFKSGSPHVRLGYDTGGDTLGYLLLDITEHGSFGFFDVASCRADYKIVLFSGENPFRHVSGTGFLDFVLGFLRHDCR